MRIDSNRNANVASDSVNLAGSDKAAFQKLQELENVRGSSAFCKIGMGTDDNKSAARDVTPDESVNRDSSYAMLTSKLFT